MPTPQQSTRCKVQVIYATGPNQVFARDVLVPNGKTIEWAINASGINSVHNIDYTTQKIGIFGKFVPLNTIPQNGDRIEIYRKVDPAAQKLARQKKQDQQKQKEDNQ